MVQQVDITLTPFPRGIHLITNQVVEALPPLPQVGMLHLFIKHTSAALSINENADPAVRVDLEAFLERIAPEKAGLYTHVDEGPDDMPSHIKGALMGYSVQIPITHGRLNLGTWQGIYLFELRNRGGARKMVATVFG